MKNKTPLAHNEGNLIVGKYYMVAHAEVTDNNNGKTYTLPIIPIKHSDNELGVSEEHYHIDGRFGIHNHLRNALNIKHGITGTILSVEGQYVIKFQRIIYIRKRCIRTITGLPEIPLGLDDIGTIRYWTWYGSMIGKKCAGKKCPHRGAIMREDGNQLICPLHKLHADRETGTICWPYGQTM